ncbi:MAG: hypothetical protein R3B06_21520 [Kofleriaceae bacterium]
MEALVGRVIVKGLEKKPQMIKGVPQKLVPPTWFVALDYAALFLLYFATVLGVLTLVVGRLEARAGRPTGFGDRARQLVAAAVTLVLCVGVLGGAINRPGPAWMPVAGLAGVAVYAAAAAWRRRVGIASALGVTLVAAPIVVFAVAALLARHLWNEEQIFAGDARARFEAWTRAALLVAAMGSPYLLAPRPFARTVTRVVPFVVALAVATIGATMLRLDYLATIAAVNRVFGLDLEPRAVADVVSLYLLAFATMVWTITACLVVGGESRRRVGVALGLVVLAGLGFPWPMNFAVVGVGLMALTQAVEDAVGEERAAGGPVTPPIDDDAWQGFVALLVAELRADGGEVSAVSVRGEHSQTATIILCQRRDVPVRVCLTRLLDAVISVDVICGRERAGAPTWTLAARHRGHPAPPAVAPAIGLGDAALDAQFEARGASPDLAAALAGAPRAMLADDVDGWFAGWRGESVRHRVYPGFGTSVDRLLPLTELAARRAASPAAVARVVGRIELCAALAVTTVGVATEVVDEASA